MARHFPPEYRWTKPDGGMFIWVEGPPGLDSERIYLKAVERKVAYVPGKYFYVGDEDGGTTMRLNFTRVDEATIERALTAPGRDPA